MLKPYGIDVSHHQVPAALPWERIAESSSFAMVRGTYGTMKDRATAEHVRRARAVGLRVGLYHFFRPSQSLAEQLNAFRAQLELAQMGIGDIAPAIDIEQDPFPKLTPVSQAWQGSVLGFVDAMVTEFGECMVYITQREFGMLGSPEWLLTRPLWVAHYTGAAKPATPGNRPATIWQHRIGPYDPAGPGGYDKARPELDQNRLLGELPLIGHLAPAAPKVEPPTPAQADHDDGLEEAIDRLYLGVQADLNRGAASHIRDDERDADQSEIAPGSWRPS